MVGKRNRSHTQSRNRDGAQGWVSRRKMSSSLALLQQGLMMYDEAIWFPELQRWLGSSSRQRCCSRSGDTHSDHLHATAAQACVKSWSPSVRRVLCYETLSETNFGINQFKTLFRPNLFVDITTHLDRKVELLRTYLSEIADVPFFSESKRHRALALLRGSQAGNETQRLYDP